MAKINIAGVLLDGTQTATTNLAPSRQDLTFPQGEDVTFLLTVLGQGGAAFNLTGYTGTMLWKVAQGTASSTVSLTLTLSLTAPTSGQGTFTLTSAQSRGLQAVPYWYDIFVQSAGVRDEVVPTSLITLNFAVGA